MLSAFGGTAGGGDLQNPLGKTQQTVAMAFPSFTEFQETFGSCLDEVKRLSRVMPGYGPTHDARILALFIAEMDIGVDPVTNSPAPQSGHPVSKATSSPFPFRQGPRVDSRLTLLQTELQKHAGLLEENQIYLVTFAFVMGASPAQTARYRGLSGANPAPITPGRGALGGFGVGGVTDAEQSVFRESDLVSKFVPNYLHFRCRLHLPVPQMAIDGGSIFVDPRMVPRPPPVDPSELQMQLQQSGEGDAALDLEAHPDLYFDTPCDFQELSLLRHVEPSMFSLLELKRLSNFHVKMIPTSSHYVHLYEATPKPNVSGAGGGAAAGGGAGGKGAAPGGKGDKPIPDLKSETRFFVRILVRTLSNDPEQEAAEDERYFVAGLNALELAIRATGQSRARSLVFTAGNLISLSIVTPSEYSSGGVSPQQAEAEAIKLCTRYETRLQKNFVSTVEVRYVRHHTRPGPHGTSAGEGVPLRLVIDNPTGQAIRVRTYVEVMNPTTGQLVFSSLNPSRKSLLSHETSGVVAGKGVSDESMAADRVDTDYDGQSVELPHPLAGPLDQKRAAAANVSSVYIYDFLGLFEEAVKKQWQQNPRYFLGTTDTGGGEGGDAARSLTSPSSIGVEGVIGGGLAFLPERVFEAVEMATNSRGQLEDVHRPPGKNQCGMVAWRVKMCTPEFPRGRRVVIIGNDVTYQMGTFGVQEDLLYQRASEYARKKGIPRIYIACNSGARMGLATEVQKCFRVEWIDPTNPSRGFKYLYLTEKDYKRLKASDSVSAEPVQHRREGTVYKITDVIGSQVGIGVENLCGSGAIAGETSRAYQETFTITLVTGRTVGIGAYITRLGQRVIQKNANAPILLTGYQALNRLIGREVYTSNDEIGGIDVMYKNGVSHLTVKDDIEGCQAILDWLSFVPEHREGPPPIMVDTSDPINRATQYKPHSSTEDPRLMLTGCKDSTGQWQSGIFDRGTFREVMMDWAKSVIVGRARLGGIPVGVICVETRVTEYAHPADPAMPSTSEIKLSRAGQVWYPDSAYKTAQGIADINQEELPLMIFANWRGFSGGQRDMFEEVLKFGSYIVDSLVDFRQPCFVYIPPKAELRGGAWVVVDPRINAEYMEMYADSECRGGVLEPTGTVEIKFRDKAMVETATRLDPTLATLAAEDKELSAQGIPIDSPQRQEIKEKKEKRLQEILPVYKQVALHFADLHDTAVRMKRRGAVHEVVTWSKSRTYFYWRLRRQLLLFNLRSELVKTNPSISIRDAQSMIIKWAEAGGVGSSGRTAGGGVDQNYQFVQWACNSIREISSRLHLERQKYIAEKTSEFCRESIGAVVEGLKAADPQRARYLEGALSTVSAGRPLPDSAASITALQHITNVPAGGQRSAEDSVAATPERASTSETLGAAAAGGASAAAPATASGVAATADNVKGAKESPPTAAPPAGAEHHPTKKNGK